MVRYNDLNPQEQRAVQEQFYMDVESDARINTEAYMKSEENRYFNLIRSIFRDSDFTVDFYIMYIPKIKRYAINFDDRTAYYKKHESVTVDIDDYVCTCIPTSIKMRGNNGMLLDVVDMDVTCDYIFDDCNAYEIGGNHETIVDVSDDVFSKLIENNHVSNMTKRIMRKWNTVVRHVNDVLIDSADMYVKKYNEIRDNLVIEKIRRNPEIYEL